MVPLGSTTRILLKSTMKSERSPPTAVRAHLPDPVGVAESKPLGLGGLSLDSHHVLQPDIGTLHFGDGRRRRIGDMSRVETFAGGG